MSTPDANGWMPIDSAPKDGGGELLPGGPSDELLLYGPGVLLKDGRTSIYGRARHVGWWDNEAELWATRDPAVTCRATHWQPLPAPPVSTEDSGQVPGMPDAICHACGLGKACARDDCPNPNPGAA